MRTLDLVQPVPAPHKRGRIVLIVTQRCGRSVVKLVGKLLVSSFDFKRLRDGLSGDITSIPKRLNEQLINGFVHQFFHAPRRAVHNQARPVTRLISGSTNG